MADHMSEVLIRVYTMDMRRNHGNVAVAEVLRQRVSFKPLAKPGQTFNASGLILLDEAAALGPVGNAIAARVGLLVMVYDTDELLWIPTNAELTIADYWRIEMVPWVEYLRASADDDAEIRRRAHLRYDEERP